MTDSIGVIGGALPPRLLEIPASKPQGLDRFAPEPATSAGSVFRAVVGSVSSVAGRLLSPGASGISENPWDLIQQQLEVQKEMMAVTMFSNIKKSEHETQMSPVRNIRVG